MTRSAIFIVGAKRTPFGAYGGKLKLLSATDLAIHASVGAIAESNVPASKIDECFVGNVIQSSLDATYISRHVALKSGCQAHVPALTINRLCGRKDNYIERLIPLYDISGFETVCLGAESIILGRAAITLCAGSENMSQAPMTIDGIAARFGATLGKGMKAEDSLWAGLTDTYAGLPMGMTAEKLGVKYGITRDDCDAYGLRSQLLYQKANNAGIFKAEIVPVEVKGKKGMETVSSDENPRANASLPDLKKLKPVFLEGGIVTAGTASGICDGAASIMVASEKAVKEHGLKPLSRIVGWCRVGCDPSIMGIGPVEAIRGALKAEGLALADMDIIEVNEAFAAQYLSCEKELGLDREKTNLNGGAIAIGHPLGASGGRIIAHLTHELIRTGKRYAIGAACIGGGQGIAVILENAQR